jgi:hypothetical protein
MRGETKRLWFGFKRRGAAGLCVQGRGGLRPPLVLSGLLKGKGGAVGSVLLCFSRSAEMSGGLS